MVTVGQKPNKYNRETKYIAKKFLKSENIDEALQEILNFLHNRGPKEAEEILAEMESNNRDMLNQGQQSWGLPDNAQASFLRSKTVPHMIGDLDPLPYAHKFNISAEEADSAIDKRGENAIFIFSLIDEVRGQLENIFEGDPRSKSK